MELGENMNTKTRMLTVGEMGKIADALETVSDQASAQKAAEVIGAISGNLEKLSK